MRFSVFRFIATESRGVSTVHCSREDGAGAACPDLFCAETIVRSTMKISNALSFRFSIFSFRISACVPESRILFSLLKLCITSGCAA